MKILLKFGFDRLMPAGSEFFGEVWIDLGIGRAIWRIDNSRSDSSFTLLIKQVARVG